jgi:hypothetical protein
VICDCDVTDPTGTIEQREESEDSRDKENRERIVY